MLWYAIKKYGFNGFKKIVRDCVRTAEYGVKKFNELGVKAWKNDHAITIVFPKPNYDISKKWKLALQDDIAHIICMPHVTESLLDEVVKDLICK